MIVSGLGQLRPEPLTIMTYRAWLRIALSPPRAPPRCHRKELGTKNSVSNTETDVLTGVRLVPRCGNVAGTMRHVVLIACRSGA